MTSSSPVPAEADVLVRQAVSRLLAELSDDFVFGPDASFPQTQTLSEIDRADHDIQRYHSAMLAIKHEFDQRITRLSKHRNTLTIFSKLPTELAGIILGHSVDEHGMSKRIKRLKNLAMVSSEWWGIVKSCPALWTTIDDSHLPHASLSLRKSGALPLTISAKGFGEPGREYIDLVASHCYRWGFIDIDLGQTGLMDPIRRALETPMPLLESLTLTCTWTSEAVAPLKVTGGDRFSALSLEGVMPHPDSSVLQTVRRLSLSEPQKTQASKIVATLVSTTMLEYLHISVMEEPIVFGAALEALQINAISEDNIGNLPAIQLPNLRSLQLSFLTVRVVDTLLEVIHAEGLTTLRVNTFYRNHEVPLLRRMMDSQRSILTTVISNTQMKTVDLNIDHDMSLGISGDAGNLGCIRVYLSGGEEWTKYLSTLECFPEFARNLPDVTVTFMDEADEDTYQPPWDLAFLLNVPSVVSMEIGCYGRLVYPLFGAVLGARHLACPRLTLVRIIDYGVETEYWEDFCAVIRDALKARMNSNRAEPLPPIVVERESTGAGPDGPFKKVITVTL